MKPTIKDVARLAGVSISTVSRVMNSPESVQQIKRERVLEAIEELQYQPNAFARGLIYKKSGTLGVMIPDIENPYYAGLIRGMQDAAVSRNCSLMICNTDRDKDRLIAYVQSFYEKQVDGIIFASDSLHPEYYEVMKQYRFPFVLASTVSKEFAIPSVDIDNEAAAYDAVKYLIRLGHRSIGMISFPFQVTLAGVPRHDGFLRATREAGYLECKEQVEFANHRYEDAYKATARLMSRNPHITAIFAASDEFAMGAISWLQERGIQVPEQISVIGFDDIRMAQMYIPKLTTISQPVYDIGVIAVQKLHELITTGKVDVLEEIVPHKLMIRDSAKEN